MLVSPAIRGCPARRPAVRETNCCCLLEIFRARDYHCGHTDFSGSKETTKQPVAFSLLAVASKWLLQTVWHDWYFVPRWQHMHSLTVTITLPPASNYSTKTCTAHHSCWGDTQFCLAAAPAPVWPSCSRQKLKPPEPGQVCNFEPEPHHLLISCLSMCNLPILFPGLSPRSRIEHKYLSTGSVPRGFLPLAGGSSQANSRHGFIRIGSQMGWQPVLVDNPGFLIFVYVRWNIF